MAEVISLAVSLSQLILGIFNKGLIIPQFYLLIFYKSRMPFFFFFLRIYNAIIYSEYL